MTHDEQMASDWESLWNSLDHWNETYAERGASLHCDGYRPDDIRSHANEIVGRPRPCATSEMLAWRCERAAAHEFLAMTDPDTSDRCEGGF